jgi:hypothetical protein
MPDKTEARGRRSEARKRRRSQVEEPVDEAEQAAESAGSEVTSQANGNFTGAAAKVVGTAVAAGLLGALGGAAKAMFEQRQQESEPNDREVEAEPRAAEAQPEPEEKPEGEQDEHVEASSPEPEPEEPEPSGKGEETTVADEESTPEEVRGVSDGEAADVVAKARRQLEALLGTDVERVSGLEHSDDRWSLLLEVVEVARVPESTDVMATYEVVLDQEGKLVSVNRARRYRRSQVDDQR